MSVREDKDDIAVLYLESLDKGNMRYSDVGNGETRYYYFNIDYQISDNQITSLDYVGRLAVNQSTDFNIFNPYE